MAILDSVPGLEVYITVDGSRATEYDDPDGEAQGKDLGCFDVPVGHSQVQQPPYVIKYTEAKPGAPFSFCIATEQHFQRPSDHVAHGLRVDGHSSFLRHEGNGDLAANSRKFISYDATQFGNPTDGFKEHSFMFTPVETVENDGVPSRDLQKQMDFAKHCGVLKVVLFHMKKSIDNHRPSMVNRPLPDDGVQKIAEKALKGKAVDCKVSFANSGRATNQYYFVQSQYNDAKKRPFAVFEFRYRTREGLIKEAIIPRPSATQDVENMTEAEVRQRLAELLEKQHAVDAEKREGGGGIKREAPMTDDDFMAMGRYKARRLDNGQVEVDLTDD